MNKILLFIVVLSSIITSCTERNDSLIDQKLKGEKVELKSTTFDFISFNIPFPKGTVFEIEGSELRFTPPQPYYIVGIDESGNYHRSVGGGSGRVTCECTEGSGCDPIKNGNNIGCIMKDGCSSCDKSKSQIIGIEHKLNELVILHPESNLLITEFSQIENHYLLPNAFLEYAEVDNILSDIRSSQANLPGEEMEVVFINIHGYILPIELKMEEDNVSLKAIGTDGGQSQLLL